MLKSFKIVVYIINRVQDIFIEKIEILMKQIFCPQKFQQFAFLLLCLVFVTNAFQPGDPVKITANKLSPYGNPTESYKYKNLKVFANL